MEYYLAPVNDGYFDIYLYIFIYDLWGMSER